MKSKKTIVLAEVSILVALIILLGFTPIGYLRLPPPIMIEVTLITIPVIIGAVAIGPGAGALLGGAFGLTSFIQCFGMSAFGAALLSVNPVFTFIVCFFPRLLMGWLCGLIFKAFTKKGTLAFLVSSLSGALLNTVLFTFTLLVCFNSAPIIAEMQGEMNILAFAAVFVGINGLIEAIICAVVGTLVSAAVYKANKRYLPGNN